MSAIGAKKGFESSFDSSLSSLSLSLSLSQVLLNENLLSSKGLRLDLPFLIVILLGNISLFLNKNRLDEQPSFSAEISDGFREVFAIYLVIIFSYNVMP
ncbi:hypothetical protein HHK36_013692 [Tetracentron sinense]|uniref:Uncharacterized protein n=1 Tax=Tetracentron sinense TaxID=13715 RepID=A0A834Z3R6_TETSI|nr:hypothetical protein HHK36_013692 [Tetracentron sinense]